VFDEFVLRIYMSKVYGEEWMTMAL